MDGVNCGDAVEGLVLTDAEQLAVGDAERVAVGPGARSREPLSRERILTAAVDFVDRNGLDELSMRKLGSDLGVEAMSLYRYFPSKSELLDAMTGQLVGQLRLPAVDTDWRAALTDFALSYRDVARAHPRLFPLLAGAFPGGPSIQAANEAIDEVLRSAGFGQQAVGRAQCAIIGYMTGSVLWLLGGSPFSGAARTDEPQTRGDEFEFGIDAVLTGLQAKLGEPELDAETYEAIQSRLDTFVRMEPAAMDPAARQPAARQHRPAAASAR